MSAKAVKWARQQRTGGPIEAAVLLDLALEADSRGICTLSTRTIASHADISQATVRRALDRLTKRGLLSWSAGAGRAKNTYQLHVWQSAVVSR